MIEYHRKIIDFIKKTYGIRRTDIDYVSGSKHPRIEFNYGGMRRIVVLHHNEKHDDAFYGKRQEIIRYLGKPSTIIESKPKRSLDEMTAELQPQLFNPLPLSPPKSEEIGGVALYRQTATTKSLRFKIPETILKKFTHRHFRIKSIGKYNWEIIPSIDGHMLNATNQVISINPADYGDLSIFGMSNAEYLYIDGTILVALNPTSIKLINPIYAERAKLSRRAVGVPAAQQPRPVKPQSAAQQPRPVVGPPPVEPQPRPIEPQSAAAPQPTAHFTSEHMHQVLEQVREIERNTPYRLRRIDESGKLIFVAPRIE